MLCNDEGPPICRARLARGTIAVLLLSITLPLSLSAASPALTDAIVERICSKESHRWVETPILADPAHAQATRVEMIQCFGEYAEEGWWHMLRFEERTTTSLMFKWVERSYEFSVVSIETEPRDAQATQPLLMRFMASRRAGHVTLGTWSTYQGASKDWELFILPSDPMTDNDCAPGSWAECAVIGEEHRSAWEERYTRLLERAFAHLR